jgi:hypothetical protein
MAERLEFQVAAVVNGLPLVSSSFRATGSGLLQVRETVPAALGAEDPGGPADGVLTISWPVDVSAAKGLLLMAQGADLELETDAEETLSLVDGVPIVWTTDSVEAAPLTLDVATVTATNEALVPVSLTLVAIVDATP